MIGLDEGTASTIKTMVGTSDEFEIGVGVHQGSVLTPILFITVMEAATLEVREEALWESLYADDFLGNAETAEVKEKFNTSM